MERRLTVILAADVVGYSRLTEIDEAGVFETLQSLRSHLIDPTLADHGGRTVKLMGDGALVEFASVVAAVSAAVEIQEAVAKRNAGMAASERIEFRIGVHLGDVISHDGDIYGDGVNVASRLEGLAEPGGICISQQAYDQVGTKLKLTYADLGERKVKNIDRPIHAYQVLPVRAQSQHRHRFGKRSFGGAMRLMSVVAGLMVLGIIVVWWAARAPDHEPASLASMAFPLPEIPSLAVLPFKNMSDDPGRDHFTDGMTEDLITDLSRIDGLFVIARNSTFIYKGRSVPIRQVAEDLGVRYVLAGSVRLAGDRVRVNAQLIDATTGGHVWAERFDSALEDVFAIQDTFVRKIVSGLAINLTDEDEHEIGLGQTSNLAAREVFQRGWSRYLRFTPEENAAAIGEFERALALDPEYGRAYAALSLAYLRGCQLSWNGPLGMSASLANAHAIKYLAETRDRPSSLANVAASGISLYNKRHDDALTEATRAIAKDPNDPEAYVAMAWATITTGQVDTGLELTERAIRLDPNNPGYYAMPRGMAYFTKGNLERAAEVFNEALERDPDATELLPLLAATLARLGRRQEARAALSQWRPDASQSDLALLPTTYNFPYKWAEGRDVVTQLIDGLHTAALPPQITISGLIDELRQESILKRTTAARRLGRIGPSAARAVPALIDALSDDVIAVRREAAISLGKIGPAAMAAIPALSAVEAQPGVSFDARAALRKISGK